MNIVHPKGIHPMFRVASMSVLLLGVASAADQASAGAAMGIPEDLSSIPETVATTTSDAGSWTTFGGIANGCNGSVDELARLDDGRIIAGGSFTVCSGTAANGVAIYDPVSESWSSLGVGIANGVNGSVSALVVSGNDVYVGGSFSTAGNVAVLNIAKWDGGSWGSIGGVSNNGVSGQVNALALHESILYVGGLFTTAGPGGQVLVNRVARWDGAQWNSLGTGASNGANDGVSAIAISGSDVYIGGPFTQAGGAPAKIRSWNIATQTWGQPIAANMFGSVRAMVAISGGVYFGGTLNPMSGGDPIYVGQWTAGGGFAAVSINVPNSPDFDVHSLSLSGNDVYVGRGAINPGGARVYRFNGSTWSYVGAGADSGRPDSRVNAVLADGSNVWIGGLFGSVDGVSSSRVARWSGSGWQSVGSSSGNGISGDVNSVFVSSAGMHIGGYFGFAGATPVNNLARWNGSSWNALSNGVGQYPLNGAVTSLVAAGTGAYVGGGFNYIDGALLLTGQPNLAQWSGSSWSNLAGGYAGFPTSGFIAAMTGAEGDLLVGGTFSSVAGVVANSIARWNGAAWQALGAGSANGVAGTVNALAVSGNDIYAAGTFTQAGGATANRVAKWTGTSWSSLGTGAANGLNGTVNAIVIKGSDVYVAGSFTQAGLNSANRIARWNGAVWIRLGSGLDNGVVSALAVYGDDLYVGGTFTSAGGLPAYRIARWDGSTWHSLGEGPANGVNAGGSGWVKTLWTQNEQLYVGGQFGSVGGQLSSGLAIWTPDAIHESGFE